MTGDITMSVREINQVELFEKLTRREIRQSNVASILGISVRQIKRKLRNYKLDGAKSLVHKSRGRVSNNKISQKTLDKAINIVKEKYWDFGPTLAHEKLVENHNFKISLSSVRKEMVETSLWKPTKKRKAHIHQLRERRACFGELVQLDGSPHDWFEGRASQCNLNVAIDDASSKSFCKFSKTETTQDYFKMAEEYFLKYGLPLVFYTDKYGVFRINKNINDLKKPTQNENKDLTQFGRAMKELGIELIFAETAQAKGRVEKVNRTLQNRLVKEMRLEGISSIEEANIFIPKFIEKFNQKFSVKPRSGVDMHRKLDKNIDLSKILCVKETRVLSKNLTFQLENTIFQIQTKRSAFTLRKTIVTICERYDDSIKVFDNRGKLLEYTTIKQLPNRKTANSKVLNSRVDDILIKEAKQNFRKRNPWESDVNEFTEDNLFYKPSGAV